uniref:Uncharacterized protein n=1 Tax=viral metagenome TaxID=1070528 RepID=A0A6C0EUC3_9ZZZZ
MATPDPFSYGNLIGLLKDNESNTKTDIMALDRNLSNSIGQTTASIIQSASQSSVASNMVDDARFRDTKDAVNRNSDFLLNDARRNNEFLATAVERNGTSNSLATLTSSQALLSATDRTGSASLSATDRNGSLILSETIRGQGQTRDMISHQAAENRNALSLMAMDHARQFNMQGLLAKDTDLKVIEAGYKSQLQTASLAQDMLKMKSDLEKQASEHSALAVREMALVSRDVLNSRADVLRQAAENTDHIKSHADKNKDYITNQVSGINEKLSQMDVSRVRDEVNDLRAKAAGLEYGCWDKHRHGHHGWDEGKGHEIRNNLYAGYDRRERSRSRERRGGEGGRD